MKKGFLTLLLITVSFAAFSWGSTGHRVVGLIAENHLSKRAKKKIEQLLVNETLAEVSNFMDFIKSDPSYLHMSPWHYATIPDEASYMGPPEEGDVIATIERLIAELKKGEFTDGDEAFALKCLVHLVGDIHQPLHVGNGTDRGGNDVILEYFWKQSNLHRLWDSGIIDAQQYSYTEYVDWINHPSKAQLEAWSSLKAVDWANESKEYRNQCYETANESKKLTYRYNFDNLELLNNRLLQAGIRLANVLNDIYG